MKAIPIVQVTTNDSCHAQTEKMNYTQMVDNVLQEINSFYARHNQIKDSHGLRHIFQVFRHARQAVACHYPNLTPKQSAEIEIAALLHDVDDKKYFPSHKDYEHSRQILNIANISNESQSTILFMIQLVSCSENGNTVPSYIIDNDAYHLLIPRWCDRLEAVGAVGVLRCYQYNQEHGLPLSSAASPRPQTEQEIFEYATAGRFANYQARGGSSNDMISHYYDKLLHVARPPTDIVRNSYLEFQGRESSKELIEVCLRFGRTGIVDVEYIQEISNRLAEGEGGGKS